MSKKNPVIAIAAIVILAATSMFGFADEFTKEDLGRWQSEYMSVVKKGRGADWRFGPGRSGAPVHARFRGNPS